MSHECNADSSRAKIANPGQPWKLLRRHLGWILHCVLIFGLAISDGTLNINCCDKKIENLKRRTVISSLYVCVTWCICTKQSTSIVYKQFFNLYSHLFRNKNMLSDCFRYDWITNGCNLCFYLNTVIAGKLFFWKRLFNLNGFNAVSASLHMPLYSPLTEGGPLSLSQGAIILQN